mmetsp:Transcript_16620/g.30102  ORF Transcript_16620/g.30102 Transcript_16620/m.30102 type:complete len:229 (-) Transcript_16620:8-694(-)
MAAESAREAERTDAFENAICVHFVHGLESGPGGYKVQKMRERCNVIAPDMGMSLWNPLRENSLVRNLFKLRWPSMREALADSFESCVAVQREALAHPDGARPTVLVGSSWGGAVAAALVAEGTWRGPTVLMCPALAERERKLGEIEGRQELSTAHITASLAALPDALKRQCIVVHGTADETIPLEDSRALCEATGIRLREVEGGRHGLSTFVSEGQLWITIRGVLDGH